jgi:hypothetical protein
LSIGLALGERQEEELVHQDPGRINMEGMEQEAKPTSENQNEARNDHFSPWR